MRRKLWPTPTLTLLLRADLRSPAKREGERLLQRWLALDLAADVADDPAQPAAQDTQLPPMPPELFGMGVAARHHRGGLGAALVDDDHLAIDDRFTMNAESAGMVENRLVQSSPLRV